MKIGLPLAAFVGLALLGAPSPLHGVPQTSARLPAASTMLGDVRRGQDGQLEVIPRRATGRRGMGPLIGGRADPPAGTPWLAKDQPIRIPQPQFEETSGD
jgi:hypothetical protein